MRFNNVNMKVIQSLIQVEISFVMFFFLKSSFDSRLYISLYSLFTLKFLSLGLLYMMSKQRLFFQLEFSALLIIYMYVFFFFLQSVRQSE